MGVMSVRKFVLGVLAVLMLFMGAAAQEKAQKVGVVLDIDGPRLMTNRLKEDSWFQAYPSMATNLGEKMKADAATTATLEFAIGGRAVISPGTEIEIVGQRDVDVVGNKVVVKAGKMWAKIDKQSSQLQIQTSGGTMGIEGTEFVVEVDGDETELSMLEGAISVTSADGKVDRVVGGQAARFGRRGIRRRQLAREVRDALKAGEAVTARELLLKGAGFPAASRGAVRFALLHHARGKGGGRIFHGNSRRSSRRYPDQPGQDGGPEHENPGQAISKLALIPGSGTFRATWEPLPQVHSYSVTIASDADFEDVLWAQKTASSPYDYPPDARGLTAGDYYVRVEGYDENGDLMASSTALPFATPGWTSAGASAP